MKKSIFALVVSFAGMANATPVIEPALAALLRAPTESARTISVVLTHKDPPAPPVEAMPSRAQRERELMRRADVSQAKTLSLLQARTEGMPLQFRRFWISNTVIVTGPVAAIRPFMQVNEIATARLTHPYRLVRPQVHGLVRPSAAEPYTYGLLKLRIPDVRAKAATMDGRGVKVGILDTGIDASHPDLKGKLLVFKDFVGGKNAPYDDHNHGTHVAGTIAGGNASGTAIGVAPAAQLIVGKIFDRDGSSDDAKILEAMQWIADPDGNPATDDAPQLVSNSWGGDHPAGDPKDNAQCQAVDSWVKLGILPVFAAGNDGPTAQSVGLPAACPSAFAVGATNANDAIARFSSRGPSVWTTGSFIRPIVSAPGVNVTSSVPGGRYASMSGTSMATPHVAGLAALIYQSNPRLRAVDVAQAIINGAVDLGDKGNDNDFGYGRVDALKSLSLGFH